MTDKRNETPPKDLLDWLGITDAPKWRIARPLGGLLSLVIALLLLGALLAAFALLGRTIAGGFETAAGNLGAGALIVALLGAPFLVWSTVIKQKTVEFQKESHITERISKAVEQLGAEKVVDRIGRSVAIEKQDSLGYIEEKTTIQWRGEPVPIDDGWKLKKPGEWQVFSETAPNIEVRIGGLLSLERIAQDSTNYDNGRDHVRVMEILCAYVRENAPASEAAAGPFPTRDGVDTIEAKLEGSPVSWMSAQEPPRSDIQIALLIIGRRSERQRDIEAQFSGPLGKPYQIDLRETNLRKANLEGLDFANAIFRKSKLEGAFCNNADLSGANLIYAKLTGAIGRNLILSNAKIAEADFSHAILNDAKLLGSVISCTEFVGTQLKDAHIGFPEKKSRGEANRAFFINANLSSALLEGDSNSVTFYWSDKLKEMRESSTGVGLRNISLGETLQLMGHSQTTVTFSNDFLMTSFGDASVYLPEGVDRPQHWPAWQLPNTGAPNFHDEWRKWQADPYGYVPPPP